MNAGTQKIALIAHDATKPALVSWVGRHLSKLERWPIVATGSTGARILEAYPQLDVERVASGPKGGDQQIGARIVTGHIAALIFFVDAMTPMPHDVDVKALIRLATLYDLPMACSPRTADLILRGMTHAQT